MSSSNYWKLIILFFLKISPPTIFIFMFRSILPKEPSLSWSFNSCRAFYTYKLVSLHLVCNLATILFNSLFFLCYLYITTFKWFSVSVFGGYFIYFNYLLSLEDDRCLLIVFYGLSIMEVKFLIEGSHINLHNL